MAVQRVPRRPTLDDPESRNYLQSRLVVLSSRMFWSFVAFLVFIELMYAGYPSLRPARDAWILIGSGVGLSLLCSVWWVLAKRELSRATLDRIDVLYAFGTGTCFALGGYFAPDFRPAPVTCLLFTSLMVLARAILLPSTGRRTFAMSIVAFAPFFVAAVGLGLENWDQLPAAAILTAVALVFGVVTLLAVTGSTTLYGLRERASVASQLGPYSLEGKIAEGGMGVVWLARHVLLRRQTAVKLLHPDRIGKETVDRFEREVQHMSKLNHPNNVAIYDYGHTVDGRFYYAMEYLDGIELEYLVRDFGPLPAGRVVPILVQICGALHEAHDSGIVHRDIKPLNVILCARGGNFDVVKVFDYGLVKELKRDRTVGSTLNTDVILGTPGYIAPEAIESHTKLTPAVDLYAVGALAYYLLTGKHAFTGETSWAICIAQMKTDPAPPSKVTTNPIPPELERLVMACLSRDPGGRPASAAAVARELRKLAIAGWDEDEGKAWWTKLQDQLRRTVQSPAAHTIDIEPRN